MQKLTTWTRGEHLPITISSMLAFEAELGRSKNYRIGPKTRTRVAKHLEICRDCIDNLALERRLIRSRPQK